MTTAKAASNGKPTTGPQARERMSGLARIREAQAYHLSSVAHDAAFEAERLCQEVYRAASDAYLRDSRNISEAAEVLATPAMQDKIIEACNCLVVAVDVLSSLRNQSPQ